MIELKCTSCGGKLTVDESSVFVTENIVIIRSGRKLFCEYCDSVFMQGHEFESVATQNVSIVGDGNVVIQQTAGDNSVQIGQVARGSGIAQSSGGGVASVVIQGRDKTISVQSGQIGIIGDGAKVGRLTFN